MPRFSTVLVFLGPPGAGKGTQAARISTSLGVPAISTGEILRDAAKSGSELGKLVESVMASGQLVSDDLINRVVTERLHQEDCRFGFILDGYPRTVAQGGFLRTLLEELNLPEPVVFNFDLSIEKIVYRLGRRRQCGKCGGIFGVNRNAESIRCPQDGTLLVQRADDKPEAIRQRLEVYRATSADLIEFYRGRNYYEINASRKPEQIAEELLSLLSSPIHAGTARRQYVRTAVAHGIA